MKRSSLRSPESRADIIETVNYLADRDIGAAARFTRAVRTTEAMLADRPAMGSPRKFGGARLKGLRMHPVQGFKRWLIFYIERRGAIEILRVLHGARDLEALLGEADE